jgi:mobilization protein NikA
MNRRRIVHFRLPEDEYERLKADAAAASTNLSSLLRERAIASLAPVAEPAPLASLPSGGPLTSIITWRVTAAEGERLTEQARDCGLPLAAYVRSVLRGRTPSPRRPAARSALVALSRVGNNLNQLARLPLPRDLVLAVETLRGEVYQVRNEILAALGDP